MRYSINRSHLLVVFREDILPAAQAVSAGQRAHELYDVARLPQFVGVARDLVGLEELQPPMLVCVGDNV
jgi:hypothetical protein